MGNNRKALDWYFFSLTISLILRKGQHHGTIHAKGGVWSYMVRRTPTFPLVMPPRDLKNNACQKEVEKANPTQEST